MPKISNQNGFGAVEAILILVIIGILGFAGWFVYSSQKSTDKTLTDANKSQAAMGDKKTTPEAKQADTQKYLVIKEWAVKIPYTSTDTLTYVVGSDKGIQVASANLAQKYGKDCEEYGAGGIARYVGSDTTMYTEQAGVASIAALYAKDQSSSTKIGNYYYQFFHDHGSCVAEGVNMPATYTSGTNPTIDVALEANEAANALTKSILPNITPVK